MKYRIIGLVAVVAALAVAVSVPAASAAPTPVQSFLNGITCSDFNVLSGEAFEEEDPCESVDSNTVKNAVPVCIGGTTYQWLDDQDEDPEVSLSDFISILKNEFSTVASAGPCGGGQAPAPPVGIFLCYSTYQTTPGVWSKPIAEQLLQQGYWLAYAVPGNVPGGTNIGSFHLVCNLAASQSVSDQFVGGDGTVLGSSYSGVDGLYPKVGG